METRTQFTVVNVVVSEGMNFNKISDSHNNSKSQIYKLGRAKYHVVSNRYNMVTAMLE